VRYQEVQTLRVEGNQRAGDVTRTFRFTWTLPGIRFVKIHIEGTKGLPDWHASAGGTSCVFVDEVGRQVGGAGSLTTPATPPYFRSP